MNRSVKVFLKVFLSVILVGVIVAGVACFAVGLCRVVIHPAQGLIVMGVGSLLLALGIVMTVLFVWGAFKWIPALFRGCVKLCRWMFHKRDRRN